MSSDALNEIEKRLDQLSADEQLRLMEQLGRRMRRAARNGSREAALAEMAADPEVQRELKAIEEEFAGTEQDGLEKW